MPAGTQRFARTKMVLPLRVWANEHPEDASALQLAHTIDISPIGGRLGGLRTPLNPGQTITVQRGQKKAQFKVIWTKQLSASEIQAGIESLEYGRAIWGVELPNGTAFRQILRAPEPAADKAAGNETATAPVANKTKAASSGEAGRAAPSTQISAPGSARRERSVPQLLSQANAHSRVRLITAVLGALLLTAASLSFALYHQLLHDSDRVAISAPMPVPPTPETLARMTPAPRAVPAANAAKPAGPPPPRLEVAEAPKSHVVYPVSPSPSLTGQVELTLLIGTDGSVEQIRILKGKPALVEAAIQAVKKWRYSRHQLNGRPAEAETSVMISFRGSDAVMLRFPSSVPRPVAAR